MIRTFDEDKFLNLRQEYKLNPNECLLLIYVLIFDRKQETFNWDNKKIGTIVFGFDVDDQYINQKTSDIIRRMTKKNIIKAIYSERETKTGKIIKYKRTDIVLSNGTLDNFKINSKVLNSIKTKNNEQSITNFKKDDIRKNKAIIWLREHGIQFDNKDIPLSTLEEVTRVLLHPELYDQTDLIPETTIKELQERGIIVTDKSISFEQIVAIRDILKTNS